jgi:pyruvate dehydrogenase E2 component (dihydrolipoamide acetyltransferase)
MAIEIVVPRLGWTMEEGTFIEWLKHDGDAIQPGDLLYSIEGDKALTEVESMDAGILRIAPTAPAPGTVIPVGTLLGYIVTEEESQRKGDWRLEIGDSLHHPSPITEIEPAVSESFVANDRSTSAQSPISNPQSPLPDLQSLPTISPRARRVADELGVDWHAIKGSGRTGRIVEDDVRLAAQMKVVVVPSAPVVAPSGITGTRRVISERMMAGAHGTAPVTLTTEVDATELVRLREQLKAEGKAQSIPSYTDLLAKICTHALGEHPALNARLEGNQIVSEPSIHIGIAVDTDRGLLVAVLRDAQRKTLLQIAAESVALIARVREGKATADELRGSTFTITNLGMYEIDAFTPIINLPECAILGIGRIVSRQVVTLREGSVDEVERIAVRRMMTLSLTFDHRLVDGAPAARFLQRVKHLVEQPYLWLVV